MIFNVMLCLLLVTFVCGGPASGRARTGFPRTIAGVVVDKEDQPVAGAQVCAFGMRAMAGRLPCGWSKADGQFAIDVFQSDTYTIGAEAVLQGYPHAIQSFYGNVFCNFPVIKVDDSSNMTLVKVRLGPKPGRVIFTILDKHTNRRIEQGSVTVCRTGEPRSCWLMSTDFPHGQYELLTPDVSFTVKFAKSNRWVKRPAFDESGIPIEVPRVDLGARRELTVRLK
jgi:hypothetical protein